MTERQALEQLYKTGELTTDLLEPLGLSFEKFLSFSQLPAEKRTQNLQEFLKRRALKLFYKNPRKQIVGYSLFVKQYGEQS